MVPDTIDIAAFDTRHICTIDLLFAPEVSPMILRSALARLGNGYFVCIVWACRSLGTVMLGVGC